MGSYGSTGDPAQVVLPSSGPVISTATNSLQGSSPSHHSGGGITGLLGGLAHEAKGAISGTIGGAIKVGDDVIKPPKGGWAAIGKQWEDLLTKGKLAYAPGDPLQQDIHGVVQQEKATWGPLIEHGSLSGIEAHKLNAVLDALAILTGGASRAYALKTLPEAAGAEHAGNVGAALASGHYQGALRTIKVKAAAGGGDVTARTLPRAGARAARMEATDKVLKLLPDSTFGVGQQARAARAINANAKTVLLRHEAADARVIQQRTFARLSGKERIALNVLNRVPLPQDLEAWKRLIPGDDKASRRLAAQLNDPTVRALYDHPNDRMLAAHEAATNAAQYRTGLQVSNGGLDVATAADAPFRHTRFARGAKLNQGVLTGGGTAAELRAEIEAAGRPVPYYAPDTMADPRSGYVSRTSGGRTPPPTDIHQSEGTLFKKGLVAVHIDTLGPSFMRAATRDAAIEKHAQVMAAAVPSETGNLAHGYRWVRAVRGQSIPKTATAYGEHVNAIDEALPDLTEKGMTHADPNVSPDEIAVNKAGKRMMIPERTAQVLENDLKVQRSVAAKIDHNILTVWRALILKVRVPWLENNVFGNTVLMGIRAAGNGGLVAVLGAIRQSKGVEAARRALRLAESKGVHLDDALVREKLPELSRGGTFIGSQLPTGQLARHPGLQRAAKVAGAPFRVLPAADRASEGALRRAAAEVVLKGSPEVKALYKAMPAQTRTWHAAMSKGLDDPDLRRLVVREVNDALGNFLSLTPAENGAVRTLVPFYAWFREIVRITAKLPIDAPGRADILAKVGTIGKQQQDATLGPLPSYLQGSIAVGKPNGDIQSILALRSANPLTSAQDVASAAGALLPGGNAANVQNLLGDLNPFIQAGIAAAGKVTDSRGGKPSPYGLLGDAAMSVVTGLPESRVYSHPGSKLYPGRSQEDMILQFLGDLRKRISLSQAHYDASKGQ